MLLLQFESIRTLQDAELISILAAPRRTKSSCPLVKLLASTVYGTFGHSIRCLLCEEHQVWTA